MKIFLIKLVLFLFIAFFSVDSIEAAIQGWVPPEGYGEGDSYEMDIETVKGTRGIDLQSEDLSMEDIFGDEQVFPFPPGLGN